MTQSLPDERDGIPYVGWTKESEPMRESSEIFQRLLCGEATSEEYVYALRREAQRRVKEIRAERRRVPECCIERLRDPVAPPREQR